MKNREIRITQEEYRLLLKALDTKTQTVLLSDLKSCKVDVRCAYKLKRLQTSESTYE